MLLSKSKTFIKYLLVVLMLRANFPHKLLLTDRLVSKFCKAFENNSSANIKLPKVQLSEILQSGVFLGRLFGPVLSAGLLFHN